jgi:hypothetical protein
MPKIELFTTCVPGKCVAVQAADFAGEGATLDVYLDEHAPFYRKCNDPVSLAFLARGKVSASGGVEVAVSRATPCPVFSPDGDVVCKVVVSHDYLDECESFVGECIAKTRSEVAALVSARATPRRFMFDQGYWELLGDLKARSLETVFVPKTRDALFEACKRFFEDRARYERHGVPYKMNVLLEGPPGSGKTSLVNAVAHALGCDVYILNFTSKVNDADLASALKKVGAKTGRSVIVAEDIESAFSDGRKRHDSAKNSVTSSGLLNCLDGLSRPEGSIFFVTANDASCLDPVFTRSGRIDHRFATGPLDKAQVRDMTESMVPGTPAETVERLADTFKGLAAADLSGFLFSCAAPGDVASGMDEARRAAIERSRRKPGDAEHMYL